MMHHTIERLRYWLTTVPKRIARLSKEELAYKPKPDKWSKKEILGHLTDSALHNWQRFATARFQEGPLVVKPYPQDELVRENEYQKQSIGQIVNLWRGLNLQIVHLLENIPNTLFEKEVSIPYMNKTTDLKWLVEDYLVHMEHHLSQIFLMQTEMEWKQYQGWHVQLEDAILQLENDPAGKLFIKLQEHGSMNAQIYAPQEVDNQRPHIQDEIYVVISGSGFFRNGDYRHPFGPGDVMFVPAGVEHRFEDFSSDFKTWVFFYGPRGGEEDRPQYEVTKTIGDDTYFISTDPARLDEKMIHKFLTRAYWAKGRSLDMVIQSIKYSLNFGLYHKGKQIGFARVITDYSTFAYLGDVFILRAYRGKGLGNWLMESVMECPFFKPERGWLLRTKDEHRLYERFGFKMPDQAEHIMERKR